MSLNSLPWFFWVILVFSLISLIHIIWFVVYKGVRTYDKKTPLHCNIILITILALIVLSLIVIFEYLKF